MKTMRRTLAWLLLTVLLLVTTGCGAQDEWEAAQKAAGLLGDVVEDPQLRENTQKMLDALITDDFASAYSLVSEVASETEFRSVYAQLQPALADLGEYELVASYINKNVNNGVSTTGVRYMLTAGEKRLFVEVTRVEGYDGLTSFYINEYDPVITTGTLGSMQGADALQWIFLVVGLLELAFVVVVFVDCCRHKMKKKWLWLLIIALGYMILSIFVTQGQFQFAFNVGVYLNYTSLIHYSTGEYTARIVVPLGAIIYLCLRKSLFAKYVQLQQQKEVAAQPDQIVIPAEETTQADAGENASAGVPETDT